MAETTQGSDASCVHCVFVSRGAVVVQELGASFKVGDIPADLMDEAQEWREKLLEQVVEMDDDAMEKYLDVCFTQTYLPCLHPPCPRAPPCPAPALPCLCPLPCSALPCLAPALSLPLLCPARLSQAMPCPVVLLYASLCKLSPALAMPAQADYLESLSNAAQQLQLQKSFCQCNREASGPVPIRQQRKAWLLV